MQVYEAVRKEYPGMVVMMPHPYSQVKLSNGRMLREFADDVDPVELIWHQDRLDREVKVIKAAGWKLQLEHGLPFNLCDGITYVIPARSWHRVIKGQGNLTIEITEFESDNIITTEKRRDHAQKP